MNVSMAPGNEFYWESPALHFADGSFVNGGVLGTLLTAEGQPVPGSRKPLVFTRKGRFALKYSALEVTTMTRPHIGKTLTLVIEVLNRLRHELPVSVVVARLPGG